MTFKLADIVSQASRDMLLNCREKKAAADKVAKEDKRAAALKNFSVCPKHKKFFKKEAGCSACQNEKSQPQDENASGWVVPRTMPG